MKNKGNIKVIKTHWLRFLLYFMAAGPADIVKTFHKEPKSINCMDRNQGNTILPYH